MQELVVEREYPYKHSLFGSAILFLFCAVLAVLAAHFALTDDRGIVIFGVIEFKGLAASVFRWVVFICMGALFVVTGLFFWNGIKAPDLRIAFTSHGILMPTSRWTTKEEHIEFSKVSALAFEGFKGLGPSKTSCLHLWSPYGKRSIAREKLPEDAFDEICEYIINKLDPSLVSQIDPLYWFEQATQREMKGEWDQAFRFYKLAAEQLQGHQDGEYAQNCIRRIREKLTLAANGNTSDSKMD